MSFSFLPYSIVNDVQDGKDTNAPYSFLAFIQYQNFLKSDINDELKSYQKYLNTWARKKGSEKTEEKLIVRDAYINLLREITLNFSTEEERKFILNSDFNDNDDLDIIIPFFIQKLKQISFYYKEKRTDVKNSVVRYNLKGSNFGIESIVEKIIYDSLEHELNLPKDKLNEFYSQFNVSIAETFSESDIFFDKKNDTSYTKTNLIDTNVFLDFKQAIKNAINKYPFYLENSKNSYIENFAYQKPLTGSEINYLKPRDFLNYITDNQDNLKINLLKNLYPKYLGNTFYYLSTNSNNDSVSGVLFESNKFDEQYLNKYFPTSIYTESFENIKTIYEIGGFFVPQNQGILIYNTPKKTIKIDKSKLEADKVYIFPDPNKIGNVSYSTEESENYFLSYLIDTEWNKYKLSNGYRFNDVLSNNYNQLFYAYQSKQQNTKISTEGISKVTDNITFWKGDKDLIWDGFFDDNELLIEQSQKSLLLDEGVVVDWYCDENNNEFALFKKINTFSKKISSYILDDGGLFSNSNTEFENREINDVSLYEKRKKHKGKIFIKNSYYNNVNNISDALSAIFFKYPSEVKNEIENEILTFFQVKNILIIETTNYVISDAYSYDIQNNIFYNINTKPFYERKTKNNRKLDVFINSWYDEKNSKIFLTFLKTENSLITPSNKTIYPEIYATNINKINYNKVYPTEDTDTGIYSLSSNDEINFIEYFGGAFKKNSILNEYDLSYMLKNSNGIPFIINEKLSYLPEKGIFKSNSNVLLKPYYYYFDNNYSNTKAIYDIKYKSNKSGRIAIKNKNTLDVISEKDEDANYFSYGSNNETFQINKAGKYTVKIDWESFDVFNFFIGSSAINVSRNKNNFIFKRDSVFYVLSSYDDSYHLFDFDLNENTFKVDAEVPLNTKNEILLLNVTQTKGDKFLGKFYDKPIHKYIELVKMGSGDGAFYVEPDYCVVSENTLRYPLGTTVTIVASAANDSIFDKWYSETMCDQESNDCTFILSNSQVISANFIKI